MSDEAPAGWYQDPEGPQGQQRYWDGSSWTEQRSHAPPAFAPAKKSGGGSLVLKIAAGVVLGLGVLIVGCSALLSSSFETETVDQADNDKAGGEPKRAALGDSLTLKGNENAAKVTAIEVLDPVKGEPGLEKPKAGNRYVGVRLMIENTGNRTYADSPSNGAKVVMGDDTQADSTILVGGRCVSSAFADDVKIAPGSKRQGCIPFEVPKNGRVKTVQFGLDSGFGPQTGEWRVGGGR